LYLNYFSKPGIVHGFYGNDGKRRHNDDSDSEKNGTVLFLQGTGGRK
jgi:hypothetical protein